MDDKGYAFTPLAFLLMIPVVIVAVSYGGIVNELNMMSQIAIGGSVTSSTESNIITTLQKSLGDAGRNATFNATRTVIDKETELNGYGNPFLDDSRSHIKNVAVSYLNTAVIATAQQLGSQQPGYNYATGRQIYINNVLITNTTPHNASGLTANNLTIYQTEPFGFYISIKKGIPITVVQNGQNFTGYTPNITAYVSIQGMDDAYIWVNTLNRRSDVIYQYPFYASYSKEYHFTDNVDDNNKVKGDTLQHLWDCLNGTGNAANLANNPYYFPDPFGLNFFDRLENRTSSTDPNNATRMSTFILGDPLVYDVNGNQISAVDHEYFARVHGNPITIGGSILYDSYSTPVPFYLSNTTPSYYFNLFNLKSTYGK